MHGLTKILLSSGLLMVSSIALAQNAAAPGEAPNLVRQPSAPGVPVGTVQPVMDSASYTYLPWIGQNEILLTNYANFFYQLVANDAGGGNGPYMSITTALANGQLIPTWATTIQNSAALTMSMVQNVLAYGGTPLDKTANPTVFASVPGTDIVPPNGNKPGSDDFAFNADNILGTIGYKSDVSPSVNQLVVFLSGAATPIPGLTFSDDSDTRNKQLIGINVQQYLLESRGVAAAQSVAFSNLNYLAQERAIVPNLGAKAGMTTLPTGASAQAINDASQLQLEQFLVDRRVGNSSWYTNMNTASSTAVQRETLYVLAEISKQIFEQKMLMERMLAQQAALQQQASVINSTKLAFDQQTVQQGLNAMAGNQNQ